VKKDENNPDIEEENIIVGPGKLLLQARESLGLSVEDVAKKLNFRIALVNDIEADIFDNSLSKTFNRGYLTNYARLVGLPPADILFKFEQLTGESTKHSVMQSFSRSTEKQAESNIIMWISYGVIALLIGSTVMWWLQDINTDNAPQSQLNSATVLDENKPSSPTNSTLENEDIDPTSIHIDSDYSEQNNTLITEDNILENSDEFDNSDSLDNVDSPKGLSSDTLLTTNIEKPNTVIEQPSNFMRAVFTFSGDCWVNIYDGNDERIAWGIKKAGYVMELNAVPPLKVTVGKPELVAITVDDIDVDLSAHSIGNIAKFTLPKS